MSCCKTLVLPIKDQVQKQQQKVKHNLINNNLQKYLDNPYLSLDHINIIDKFVDNVYSMFTGCSIEHHIWCHIERSAFKKRLQDVVWTLLIQEMIKSEEITIDIRVFTVHSYEPCTEMYEVWTLHTLWTPYAMDSVHWTVSKWKNDRWENWNMRMGFLLLFVTKKDHRIWTGKSWLEVNASFGAMVYGDCWREILYWRAIGK